MYISNMNELETYFMLLIYLVNFQLLGPGWVIGVYIGQLFQSYSPHCRVYFLSVRHLCDNDVNFSSSINITSQLP